MTKLGRLPIPVPPFAEQKRIVSELERRLSTIDEIEAQVALSIHRCKITRQSILERAFEGKLVPQDPNDEPASALLERVRQAVSADSVVHSRKRTAASPGGRRERLKAGVSA